MTWFIGSSHTIATISPQTSGGTKNTFASWSDGGALSHPVTAPSAAKTYTAAFNTSYLLTTAANPSIGGTVSPVSGTFYPSGTVVNLTATANSGYGFTSWTGSVANPNNASTTVAMTAPQSVTANFQTNTIQVTVGTSPAGLSFSVDGTSYSSAQTLTWSIGSSHTIATISPQTSGGTQNTFASWSDGGALSHPVTAPSAAKTYTAAFNTSYLLTTAANPSNGGAVSPVSGTFYPSGTVVNLTATANSGYAFTSWTGSVANANNASTTVAMTAPQSVTANFSVVSSTGLSFTPSSVNFGTVTLWGGTSQYLTVANHASTTITFSQIFLSSLVGATHQDLTYDGGCMSSLAPGKTCKITLSLWPSQVGNVSAILNLQDNAAGSPQHVLITAMVIAPNADADPPSLSFASQAMNTTSVAQTVTPSNPGAGSLTINGIALGGPNSTDFLVQSTTCGSSLAQGLNCTISVAFRPKAGGSRSATLKISDNAQSGTQTVSLSGRGN